MRAEAQILKGHLDTLLLATLADGPRHGYAVKERLREASGARFDLPTGTIYPALRRTESAGLLEGTWSVVSGRRRRSYALTAAGRRRLSGDRASWQDFASAVTAILDSAACPAT
jgi:PadR family transcriptional regulator, regulatory protein PadR